MSTDFLFHHSRECILELDPNCASDAVSVIRMNSAAEAALGLTGHEQSLVEAGSMLAQAGGDSLKGALEAETTGLPDPQVFEFSLSVSPKKAEHTVSATLGRDSGNRLFLVIQPMEASMPTVGMDSSNIQGVPDEYLANVGHELRTPMNSILGFAELLTDMDLNEEQLAYVNLLRQSGGELLAFINNFLDYSKAAANKLKIDRIEVDLRVLIEDVAYTLAIQAEQKGIELACHVDHRVPRYVVADPQYLRQVLNNLAGNAIKFTPTGEVVIEVARASESNRGSGHGDDVWLAFSVSDTGIGIPADRLELIFERFAQADNHIQRQFGGTGLGLTISRQLVELMGGRIRVESEPGRGATFRFSIPVRPGVRRPELRRPTGQRDIAGKQVLVADANTTYRRILLNMLMAFGCHPVAVPDGRTALEVLQNKTAHSPVDVVIMELSLPDMTGASLARSIHGNGDFKDTRIIVLTSMTRRRQAKEMAALGCHGYLTKPVRQAVLHDVICEVLSDPVKPEATRPLITRHSVAESQFKGVRVLLAEDNEVSAQFARRLLKNNGYSVVAVPDGEKAIRAYQRDDFDLIVMDMQMPEMDGLEAAKEIRRLEAESCDQENRKHPIPIVALTASDRKADWDNCLAAGMDACATKPIHQVDLMELIDGLLQHQIKSGRSDGEPAGQAPPIDAARAMAQAVGDPVFLKELVKVFIASIEEQARDMEAALASGHLNIVADIAHKAKGAAANVFAGDVHDVVSRLETNAGSGAVKDVKRLIDELYKSIDRLRTYTADDRWVKAR